MKNIIYLLCVAALASCASEPTETPDQVAEFSIASASESYQGLPQTSCFLADPYDTLVLVRVNELTLKPAPPCDAVPDEDWLGRMKADVEVLATTSDSLPVGTKTEMLWRVVIPASINGDAAPFYLVSVRNVDGIWVQGFHDTVPLSGINGEPDAASKLPDIEFPTNWPELKSEVLTNAADYAGKCPGYPMVTQAEFEARLLDPNVRIEKYSCDVDETTNTPVADDGDDSY
ncbi:MAG: hypothetical protein R3E66_12530 [bacterium]